MILEVKSFTSIEIPFWYIVKVYPLNPMSWEIYRIESMLNNKGHNILAIYRYTDIKNMNEIVGIKSTGFELW